MNHCSFTFISARFRHAITVALLVLWVSGCSGTYSGNPPQQLAVNDTTPSSPAATDAKSHFDARVQDQMDYCRTCHVPEGVADTPEGERFLLLEDPEQDYDLTFNAWDIMDRGVDSNLLLTMSAGTADRDHSGGSPWPEASDEFNDMRMLLVCWETPEDCGQTDTAEARQEALRLPSIPTLTR